MSGSRTRVTLHGGPKDGWTGEYPSPLPVVLVMAEQVTQPGCVQPGLRYHNYRRVGDGTHYDWMDKT